MILQPSLVLNWDRLYLVGVEVETELATVASLEHPPTSGQAAKMENFHRTLVV